MAESVFYAQAEENPQQPQCTMLGTFQGYTQCFPAELEQHFISTVVEKQSGL